MNYQRSTRLCQLITAFVFTLVGARSQVAFGQAHFGDPHAGLAVHGAGDAAELGQVAAKLYKSANDDLGKWIELGNKNKLDSAKPADIAKLFVQIQQLARAGKHLSIYGEPAAADYLMRQLVLSNSFSQLFATYKQSGVAQQYVQLCRAELAKTAKARAKTLDSLQKLIQAKKFVEAEKELDATLDDLDLLTLYLTPEEAQPITKPFGELRYHIDGPAKEIRVELAQKTLAAARDGAKAEGAASVASLTKAVAALALAASVDVDGQSLSGPQIVALIDKTLVGEHAAMLRRRATEMARMAAMEKPSESPERKAIEEQYAGLHKQLIGLLPAVIAADAARATEAECVALYDQHLAAASVILLKLNSDSTKEEVRKAIAQIAAKSPALAGEVAAQDATCREYLRWQKRTAAVMAKAKSKEFLPLAQVFAEGASVDPKTLIDGLFNPGTSFPDCYFWAAVPRVVVAAQPKLAGKLVTVKGVFPLESGGSGVSRYADRTIAMIGLPDLSAQATALQTAMLGEEKAVRSLDAAIAIEGTKRGWLQSAGGAIEDLFVESVLTRFAKTPEAIAHLTPLGSWNEEPNQSLLKHALGRFVVKPNWYQGEYFFAVAQ